MLSISHLIDPRIQLTLRKPLSLRVHARSAVALKGPNGSGKTSLLKMIVGIIEPKTVHQITLINDYAYLPCKNALFDVLKVSDYLTPSSSLLNKLGGPNQWISDLSAGQKRILSLELVKLSNKKVWIIDEPTTHLDTHAKENFYMDVHAHCENGGAVLISTHDDLPPCIKTFDLTIL